MNSRSQTILDYAIVTMIAGMILSTVSSQKIPSLLFYILIAASCFNWYVHYKKGTSTEGIELKQHKTLFIPCSVSLIAVLVSKAVHLNMSGTEIEKAVRFSIGLPLLYAGLRFIPYERLKHSLWGVYVAIVFQFGYVLSVLEPNSARPITSNIHNAVSYAVIGLLLTIIALLSIGILLSKKNKLEFIFKLLIVNLGGIAFILLQTRTGVIAIPLFVLLIALVFFYNQSWLKKCLIIIVGMGIVFSGLFAIPSMESRVEKAVSEYKNCIESNISINSSVCVRMQLTNASLAIWKDNLLFGTGDNSQFQDILQTDLLKKGVVTEYTSKNFGEPHNDYMQNLSSFGILGIVGLFLLYFVPGYFFFRRLISSADLPPRCIAAMGAATCLSFPVFSLTELMFRNMRTISFYTTLVILFVVLLDVFRQSKLTTK